MSYEMLLQELKLPYCAFAITRTDEEPTDDIKRFGCINQVFPYVAEHGAVVLGSDSIACRGSLAGLGLRDGIPDIPGGFGNFIAQGGGPGCPAGERIKATSELGEHMLFGQPQDVMGEHTAIRVAPYRESEHADTVSVLANPDQLSALFHLYSFRSSTYDDVMVPVVSGCSQIFRLPFGELGKNNPKAVLGNVDFFSRPHLEKDLFSFTVPAAAFRRMCEDVPESFLFAPAWNGIKKRL